ncbi:MAG: 4-(cytidine 5'-diphospho)-2-C-methyl-D-erythritol kinase [Gammaproteobacteria bacterium]|nr:4-(cytidine 5'-diphospho)-2-C-methyl-D-erythritol kinase [Gammaproteobacteria bacterium]
MSPPFAWPAPAKLNLFLRVTGRRPDGYHTLQTVFQFVDLCDELVLRVRGDGEVRRLSGLAGVPADRDLAVLAARLLQAATGTRLGVDLTVHKRVPAGGGLGGGSSDAATTLVALDRLWGLGLGEERLAALGLQLGADVPVFVRGRAAWAEGVGEALQPVALDRPWYLIVDPGCAVSTAAVFGDPELTRDSPVLRIPGLFRDGGDGRPVATVAGLLAAAGNDCQALVRRRYPPVDRALGWLESRAAARMTGTGGCLFGVLASEGEARSLAAALPAPWRGIVARGLNVSPLVAAGAAPVD